MVEAAARCALHPEIDATSTCSRCGRFACASCIGDAELERCTECHRGRWGALARGAFSLGRVVGDGGRLFFANFRLALALSVVSGIAMVAATSFVTGTARTVVDQLVSWAISPITTGFFVLTLHDVAVGDPQEPNAILNRAMRRYLPTLWATVASTVVTTIGLALLIFPGLRAGAMYSLCQLVAIFEPENPPMRTSSALTKGHLVTLGLLTGIVTVTFISMGVLTGVIAAVVEGAGRESWGVTLTTNVARGLVACAADSMLLVAYVNLRFGPAQLTDATKAASASLT